MPGPFTIDASVFLNAFNPYETGHAASRECLARLQAQGIPIIAPTLLLPETAAAIARGRGDATLARQFAAALSRLPHLVLIALDSPLAQRAAEVAATYNLRGSDAVYGAVALRFGCALVTLDKEQQARLSTVLQVQPPGDALKTL